MTSFNGLLIREEGDLPQSGGMEPGEARPGASEAKGGGNARVAGGTKMMSVESSVPEGTVIEKLTAIHNGRLGKLLNQLQVSQIGSSIVLTFVNVHERVHNFAYDASHCTGLSRPMT